MLIYRLQLINRLRPTAAYLRLRFIPALVQEMACRRQAIQHNHGIQHNDGIQDLEEQLKWKNNSQVYKNKCE